MVAQIKLPAGVSVEDEFVNHQGILFMYLLADVPNDEPVPFLLMCRPECDVEALIVRRYWDAIREYQTQLARTGFKPGG